ncbi:hypothetical protein Glove_196g14 [Diversispora epigaea]|uniref:Uncharacterized protein n=1 Tax=Diversispora epigaea TaxID=1348612 RepID=A0A397INH6_9GLOM|nr:hypothetical protein Glove_196g14 [Diversispora epigaea]
MDKRMFCLFINKKSNPKEPFEALRENNLNNNKNNSNENDRIRKKKNPIHVLLSKFIQLLEEENEENLVGPI